jgi:hypothetical protein
MSDENIMRKGEKIPRRPPSQFDEIEGGLFAAVKRDGLLGTALEDKNQYGPQGMIVLLLIVATLTGGVLLLLRSL